MRNVNSGPGGRHWFAIMVPQEADPTAPLHSGVVYFASGCRFGLWSFGSSETHALGEISTILRRIFPGQPVQSRAELDSNSSRAMSTSRSSLANLDVCRDHQPSFAQKIRTPSAVCRANGNTAAHLINSHPLTCGATEPPYFLTSDSQFCTSVMGAVVSGGTPTLIMNLLPSRDTSKR